MQPLGDELILRFKAGDETAFNAIYEHFYRAIFKFCRAIIEAEEEARDLTADVFFLLWKMRDQWETYVNVRAFLYLTIRNRSIDYLRSKKSRSIIENRIAYVLKREQDLIIFSQIESEVITRIREAVERLPEYYRKILKLSYHEGYKNQEIATILEINEKTVRNAKSLAMNSIRKSLYNGNVPAIFVIIYFM